MSLKKILSNKPGHCILPCHCHFVPMLLLKLSKVRQEFFLFKISGPEGVHVLTES